MLNYSGIDIVQIFGHDYNNIMNKKRILELINIMRRKTDIDHSLTIKQIITELEKKDIYTSNRKTLYDDFRYLSEYDYDVENENGNYYLSDAPFSLSEIKIIIDSINSLKNLDDRFLNNLKDKLYNFISEYETTYLKKLEYHNKHSDRNFINRLEDSLQAIRNNTSIIITYQNKKQEIFPIFIHRQNDYYYLYHHYPDNDKIYHIRFDNITSINLTDSIDNIYISKDKIISHIDESTSSFYSKKSQLIKMTICKDSEYLRNRLKDDFNNLVFTKNGFSIKASVNDALFSKLVSYKDSIRIEDKEIARQYKEFLNLIIRNN